MKRLLLAAIVALLPAAALAQSKSTIALTPGSGTNAFSRTYASTNKIFGHVLCDGSIEGQCAGVDSSGNVSVKSNSTGATGASTPANATYLGESASGNLTGVVGCDSHVFKHITTATDTLAVQGVSAKTIKICGYSINFAGTAAQSVFLENTASVNANCSSANTQITGVSTGSATTPSYAGFMAAFWTGLANTSANGLCINSTGTGAVDIDIFYTQGS